MHIRSLIRTHIAVKPETSVNRVWILLSRKSIFLVPVISNSGSLLGIIDEYDLLYRLVPDYQDIFSEFYPEGPDIADLEEILNKEVLLTARDVMNKKAITVSVSHGIYKALAKMIAYHVRSLPVLDENKKYLGLIHEDDIMRILFEKHKHLIKKKHRHPRS